MARHLERHRTGRIGWLRANMALALRRPELEAPMRGLMKGLLEG